MKVAATVTSKGQITIPREIRDSLHVGPGDAVEFYVRQDGVVEMTRKQRGNLDSIFGMLKPHIDRPRTLEEIDEGITSELEREYKPSRRK